MYELRYLNGERLEDETFTLPCEHMTTARAKALVAAHESGRKVQIRQQTRAVLTVSPNGEFERPLGSRPVSPIEDCTKITGRACFCSPCRAERRAHA